MVCAVLANKPFTVIVAELPVHRAVVLDETLVYVGVAFTVGKVAVFVDETAKEQEAVATCVMVNVAPDCAKVGVTVNVATPEALEVGVAVSPEVAPMEYVIVCAVLASNPLTVIVAELPVHKGVLIDETLEYVGVAFTVGKVAVLVDETAKEQEAVATCVIVNVAPDCATVGETEKVLSPEASDAVNPVVAPIE
jgi:hypothetical protein